MKYFNSLLCVKLQIVLIWYITHKNNNYYYVLLYYVLLLFMFILSTNALRSLKSSSSLSLA